MLKQAFGLALGKGADLLARAACRWRYAAHQDSMDTMVAAAGIAMRHHVGKTTAQVLWDLSYRNRITPPPYVITHGRIQQRVGEVDRMVPSMRGHYDRLRNSLPDDVILLPSAVVAFVLNTDIQHPTATGHTKTAITPEERRGLLEQAGVLLRSFPMELEKHGDDETPLDLAVAYGVHLQETTLPEKLMILPETRATYYALEKAGAASLLAAFKVWLGISDIAFMPQVLGGGTPTTKVRTPR